MDKAAPTRARCSVHPGANAVGNCGSCGRSLCLECAIPVRGEVVGAECLAAVLPEPPPHAPGPPPPGRRDLRERVALAGLAVALAASLLPWTRFGLGSSLFGGWGFSPTRHAGLVGPLALAGLIALWWVTRPAAPGAELVRTAIQVAAGGLVASVSILAVWHPAPFTRPAPASFLGIAGGLACALARPAARLARPDRPDRAVA